MAGEQVRKEQGTLPGVYGRRPTEATRGLDRREEEAQPARIPHDLDADLRSPGERGAFHRWSRRCPSCCSWAASPPCACGSTTRPRLGLAVAFAIAAAVYRMPVGMSLLTVAYGAAYGLFPIGWIILNVIFLYQLTVKKELFEVLRNSLADLTPDPRIQVILIAFSFGAFIEGWPGLARRWPSPARF